MAITRPAAVRRKPSPTRSASGPGSAARPSAVRSASGIGTLEECFEAWTAGYLGMHDKPVVMLDPFGHYDGLLVWLRGLIDGGYVSQTALDRLVVVDDIDDALAACAPAP